MKIETNEECISDASYGLPSHKKYEKKTYGNWVALVL